MAFMSHIPFLSFFKSCPIIITQIELICHLEIKQMNSHSIYGKFKIIKI